MGLLQNYTFTVAIINGSSFHVKRLADGTLIGHLGLDFKLFKTLWEILGFSYRLVIPEDGKFGGLDNNGSFNGMIGMLNKGEADFSGNNIFVTKERRLATSMAFVGRLDDIIYVSRKQVPICQTSDHFLAKPFQKEVWIVLGLMCLISFAVFPTIGYLFPKYRRLNESSSYWKIFSLTMGLGRPSTVMAGFNYRGVAIASLIAIVGCSLKIYGSTLAASVNSITGTPNIDTVKDLMVAIRRGNLTIGASKNSEALQSYLKSSQTDELRFLGESIERNPEQSQKDFPDAFNKILTSEYVYIINKEIFCKQVYEYGYSFKNIHIPSQSLITVNQAIAYGKTFPFKNVFNQRLRRIESHGLLIHWESVHHLRLNRDLARCEKDQGLIYINHVNLKNVFIFLISGFTVSIFCLIGERIYFIIYKLLRRNC